MEIKFRFNAGCELSDRSREPKATRGCEREALGVGGGGCAPPHEICDISALKSLLLVRFASYFNVAASKWEGLNRPSLGARKYRSNPLNPSQLARTMVYRSYTSVYTCICTDILFLILRELYACISRFICTFLYILPFQHNMLGLRSHEVRSSDPFHVIFSRIPRACVY